MTLDRSPSSVTLRLKQAEHALRNRLHAVLDQKSITFEQWQVLAALLEQPGIGMTDLAELAVIPPASLTRHVDRLVERALVIRRVDPHDKRRVEVGLSRSGQSLAEAIGSLESGAHIDVPAAARVRS